MADLRTRSPQSLLKDQLSILVGCVPGIRDGQDEAIHEARVATRRIRETLTLAGTRLEGDQQSHVARVFKRAGVALGDARDPKVMHDLLTVLDGRFSTASAVIATLRRDAARAQQAARRGLIKEIERLDLPELSRQVTGLTPGLLTLHFGHSGWRDKLRAHVAERAAAVGRSMQHASGVYFPNRSHAARLAMKRLRYALELAQETGAWRVPRAIRRLRKAQDALGQAHDREMLLGRLKALAEQDSGADRAAIESLVVFLEAEILTLYNRYLEMRSDLTAICDACERSARRRRSNGRALLAAGAALPALMMLARRSYPMAERAAFGSDDLQVKVRVSNTPLRDRTAPGSRS